MLYRICRSILRVMLGLLYGVRAVGRENVPDTGAVVLCANHTSNLDPPTLGILLRREVHYMAKAELFEMPVLSFLLPRIKAFPVKRGGVSKESIKLSIQLLQEGKVLGIFPEGTRSNAGGMGKKGAAMLALRSGATVIPAAIVGTYKPFRRMTIVYGKPLDLSEFEGGGSDSLEQATDKIMSTIRRIKAEYERNL